MKKKEQQEIVCDLEPFATDFQAYSLKPFQLVQRIPWWMLIRTILEAIWEELEKYETHRNS